MRENIDFSHFTTDKTPNKKTLDEILTKDSYANSNNLKNKLYKHNLLKEKCYKCGLGNVWNNQPISLHIDGDHFNNRIENLTILCPNCHSQTDTWCSKNPNKIKKMLEV
jgi:hypothetical protein